MGFKTKNPSVPINAYKVYLNNKVIGLLDSKDKFLDLVNEKQQEIKDKYEVDNVYPPVGLKIETFTTYEADIKSANEIYDIIQNIDPFTIDGYQVTIKYKEEKDSLYIKCLNKSDFEEAFYSSIAAFVGTSDLENYKNNTQSEIIETGSKIDSIYWEEDITTKKTRISVSDNIFTNANDISKYILFGTLDEQKSYIVKDGDTIENIIDNNKLSIEEFLIANADIPNANALLTENQEISIGLISPIVTIVEEEETIEDITDKFSTEYRDDNTIYAGQRKVIQEGINGLNRVVEKIQYKNGQINNFVITKKTVISPVVNKIIARGSKTYDGGTYINTGTKDWYWPTVSPYKITSYFGYRWGSLHDGIDVSGSGFGSPIRSSTDGVVISAYNGCPSRGYYGNKCGGELGNYVIVKTADEKYTVIYGHMATGVKVGVGESVTRGQIIGYMGSSGSSTGTHLHFEINLPNGTPLNPCRIAFSC